LKIESEPPQSFFASFELQGRAASGSLSLFSPVSTVAVMNWTPGEATLKSSGAADALPQRFASVEDMLSAVSGAPIPVPALFDWLAGRNAAAQGWTVDLSEQAQGRILASRNTPFPALVLRVVLDK
jgi:outer membrane lipoprotein LolB